MHINTYVIVERAVYEGAALGISNALTEMQQTGTTIDPNKIVETIHTAVMNELSLIVEFNQQELPTTTAFNQLANERNS